MLVALLGASMLYLFNPTQTTFLKSMRLAVGHFLILLMCLIPLAANAAAWSFDSFSVDWPDGFRVIGGSSKSPVKMAQFANDAGIAVTFSGPIPAPNEPAKQLAAKSAMDNYAHTSLVNLAARHGDISVPLSKEDFSSGGTLYLVGCDGKASGDAHFALFFLEVSASGAIMQVTVEGRGFAMDYIDSFRRAMESSRWSDIAGQTSDSAAQLGATTVTPEHVRLLVREPKYVEAAQAAYGPNYAVLDSRPVVPGLLAVVVIDTPRATRPMTNADLAALGLSLDQVFGLARQNIEAQLGDPAVDLKPVGPRQIGTLRGYFQGSRLAIPADWDQLAHAQKGSLLVALPTTDLVLYASETDVTAVDALRSLSQSIALKSANVLAPSLVLRWTEGGWKLVQ